MILFCKNENDEDDIVVLFLNQHTQKDCEREKKTLFGFLNILSHHQQLFSSSSSYFLLHPSTNTTSYIIIARMTYIYISFENFLKIIVTMMMKTFEPLNSMQRKRFEISMKFFYIYKNDVRKINKVAQQFKFFLILKSLQNYLIEKKKKF